MVVDGAVVMVENIIRHLGHRDPASSRAGQDPGCRARGAKARLLRHSIIISGYLPIFTLQRVEGRLFRPMAWTVGFALLGAMIFSMTIAPVLVSFLFRKETPEWHNPVVVWLTKRYRQALTWSIHHRWVMVGVAVLTLCGSIYLVDERT